MPSLGIEARYTGAPGLFTPGQRYALFLSIVRVRTAPVQIVTQDGRVACPYGSMRAFLDNWEVLH